MSAGVINIQNVYSRVALCYSYRVFLRAINHICVSLALAISESPQDFDHGPPSLNHEVDILPVLKHKKATTTAGMSWDTGVQ